MIKASVSHLYIYSWLRTIHRHQVTNIPHIAPNIYDRFSRVLYLYYEDTPCPHITRTPQERRQSSGSRLLRKANLRRAVSN